MADEPTEIVRIEHLEVLCATVAMGSVTAAATHLGISQPTETRRLQRLEAELGTPLLRTDHRTVTLTGAEERTTRTGADVVRRVAELREELAWGPLPVRGRLRIAGHRIRRELFLVYETDRLRLPLHDRFLAWVVEQHPTGAAT